MELTLYNKFKEEVIAEMQPNDMITRQQIKYKMNISSSMVDRLLWYIKKYICTDGFNNDSTIPTEGYKVKFEITKTKMTKMYIIKL